MQGKKTYFYNLVTWLLRLLVSLGTILILVVMPFYFQEGFTHIGSDKSYFFRTGTVKLGKVILPVLAVWILCYICITYIERVQTKGKPQKGKILRQWAGKLRTPDYFAFFYGVSVILSYLCSNYKETARWGTTGWFMGLVPQLSLVALYFLIRCFQIRAVWMLAAGMASSAVVFILGYLNRFGVWPLRAYMDNTGIPAFISTIGNINWYCGYMMAIFFVGVGLLWLDRGKRKGWVTALLCGYVFLGFATLITQGSDSGIFALAVVLFAMFVLSAGDGDMRESGRFWLVIMLLAAAGIFTMGIRLIFPGRMNFTSGFGNLLTYSPLPFVMAAVAAAGLFLAGRKNKPAQDVLRRGMCILSKICCIVLPVLAVLLVGMIVLNTIRPGSLGPLSGKAVFNFNARWGSSRGATWTLGVRCFGEQDFLHKLTGVGPDCMADFLYKGSSDELLMTAEEYFTNMRLTNAHCELLTILLNEGLLGAVSYAGLFISLICELMRARADRPYATACGLCVLAYFANSMWSFQQSMGAATIFVIMGLGARQDLPFIPKDDIMVWKK